MTNNDVSAVDQARLQGEDIINKQRLFPNLSKVGAVPLYAMTATTTTLTDPLSSSEELQDEELPNLEEAQEEEEDSSSSAESSISLFNLLLEHGSFSFGSLFGTVEALITLVQELKYFHKVEHGSAVDDDDGSYTNNSGSFIVHSLEYWTVNKMLDLASTICYLLNAVTSLQQQGHRLSGPGIALTFGLAALADLFGSLLYDPNLPWPSYLAATAAVHLYLFSALLTVKQHMSFQGWTCSAACGCQRRWTLVASTEENASNEDDNNGSDYDVANAIGPVSLIRPKSAAALAFCIGDALFLTGSFIDVSIEWVDRPLPDNTIIPSRRWICLAAASVTSGLLWFVDSLIYLVADIAANHSVVPSSPGTTELLITTPTTTTAPDFCE